MNYPTGHLNVALPNLEEQSYDTEKEKPQYVLQRG